MIQKKPPIPWRHLLTCAALALAGTGCNDATPVSNPVDPVLNAHRSFLAGRLDDMGQYFDYRGLLSEQLGEIWTTASDEERTAARRQLHAMMVTTTQHLWASVDRKGGVVPRVHRVTDAEAWVLVNPRAHAASAENHGKIEWRYRVIKKDGVWSIRQREYTVGNQRSNTQRFYPAIIRHLRQEYGRAPTLSELVANLPSLQKRTRVKRYKLPSKSSLKKTTRESSHAPR